jgi:GDPmannose 4,6-dehydratase
MKKKALICGISGQDGSYLAENLINRGYEVIGTSRDAEVNTFGNLKNLGIQENIKAVSMRPTEFVSILKTIEACKPDEIYHLSGQSSVGLSYDQPVETLESISTSALYMLEAIRYINKNIKIYLAGSSECFGDNKDIPANESTPLQPKSPYAVGKATAFWLAKNYRDAYGIFACTGILFNHESPLRPERFVTQKIVKVACRIALGSKEKLKLGNLCIVRDWGWAPEYVVAMHLMLQQSSPDDYVIATGESNTLGDFVESVFAHLNLDWKEHVVLDSNLLRPNELNESRADPAKANKLLSWSAKTKMREVTFKMVQGELGQAKVK